MSKLISQAGYIGDFAEGKRVPLIFSVSDRNLKQLSIINSSGDALVCSSSGGNGSGL